ncbi:glycosyltransferase family 39 protein [Pelagovum pacificum]|nr:glycosyltransferase family 39 protein [Pelagovum pacificum]
MTRTERHWLLAVVAAGTLLRLIGIGWDGWLGLHPDEWNLVQAALRLDWPNRLLPDFFAYNGLAVTLPRLLGAAIALGPPEAHHVYLAARLISALAGGAAIFVAARVALQLAGSRAALLTAGLIAVSEPLIRWSHFGTTESALTLAVLLLWLLAIHAVRAPSRLRDVILPALVTGLALGLKTSAAAFLVLPVSALLLNRARPLRLALPDAVLLVLLAVALMLATSPGMLLDWTTFRAVMAYEGGIVAGTVPVFYTRQFDGSTPLLFELRQLWGIMDGAPLLLAPVGMVLALRSKRWKAALPALGFVLLYGIIVTGWEARFVRYLAPVIPILLVFAGLAADRLLRLPSVTGRVALIIALGVPVASGLSTALGFLAQDPRIAAGRWVTDHAQPGDMVMFEPAEPGVVAFANVESAVLPLEAGLSGDAPPLAEAVAEADILPILSRRHWSVLPRYPGTPLACAYYTGLTDGSFGFRPVATFRREAPLAGLFFPGLAAEETRVVFDRPHVVIFARTEAVPAETIARLLDTEQTCDIGQLAGSFAAR